MLHLLPLKSCVQSEVRELLSVPRLMCINADLFAIDSLVAAKKAVTIMLPPHIPEMKTAPLDSLPKVALISSYLLCLVCRQTFIFIMIPTSFLSFKPLFCFLEYYPAKKENVILSHSQVIPKSLALVLRIYNPWLLELLELLF